MVDFNFGYSEPLSQTANTNCCMTPIKGVICLAETSFQWLWQILMFINDELNLAQDRQTSGFSVLWDSLKKIELNLAPARRTSFFFTAAWQLKIDIEKLTQEIASFLVNILQVKCFELRVSSFYENNYFSYWLKR